MSFLHLFSGSSTIPSITISYILYSNSGKEKTNNSMFALKMIRKLEKKIPESFN